MAKLVEKHDPYSETDWDEFERLVISINNQQLSTASAAAVRERFYDVLDHDVTPETVLAADEDELHDAGLSRRKIDYIQNAARAFQEHDLTREGLADYTDEEVVERLTEIKGIGEWTARMFLLFPLGREDVFPIGDLAVRRAIENLYGAESREEMHRIAENWRPYRSYATRLLWAEYES
ncbi:DNA-3-methyladenine glycosylase family protein [Halomarina salina]|uniref:DNA-3-methyladenine glycosylase family protein n=1 Tax=Halomarina salina TaxID=1872699 RepID=A0ABD5RRZ8_9EURY|nr:DNA-3-methyladenine glycosylase 2 family protein [Halomarina salina]